MIKNIVLISNDGVKFINDTKYNAKSVKYPNNTQFINCNSLFFSKFDLKINIWITIKAALNRNVVIPILILVISANEYDMELIGVVPSVDIIEKATPSDITNKPKTNNNILLNIFFTFSLNPLHHLLCGNVAYVYI